MHLPLCALLLGTVPFAASTFQSQQPFTVSGDSARGKILHKKLDAAIDAILKDFNSPGGVGVAVVQKNPDSGGWTVETKGYGFAKVDGTKVTSDTMFAIGSNSKLFDILATGLLISNETLSPRISWETKIASFVPEWQLMDPVASSQSTIMDVMSHRTGLPRHDFIFTPDFPSENIRRLRYLKPSTGFREQWQYNNHMYTLISYFPQLLAGVPFETYVNDFILRPLGMNSTTYYSKKADENGHLADGMGRDGVNQTEDVFGLGQVRAYPFWAPNEGVPRHVISGAGGVISNAKDMAIWLQALLLEGQHPVSGNTVIPTEVIRKVAAGITVASPVAQFPELSPMVYGGGQARGTYRGFGFIEHGGSVLGFKSQVTRIPDQNFGVAVLSNDEAFGTQIVEAIKFRIMDEVLNLEPIDWSARMKALTIAGFKSRPTPTARPKHPRVPPFSAIAGNYRDPGYGTLELCLVYPESHRSSSEPCLQLVEETPTRLPDTLDHHIPTFLAKWKGFGVTHVAFTHFDRNLFNVTGLFSIPTGNSSEKPYWVQSETHPGFVAEFSSSFFHAGIGIRGFWGAGEGVESPQGHSVRDRAEVWFEKIKNH
ncbi:beta-lactamase/transpeptidase-like protein [Mycena polygramma]|nr:beta-lactamase/transpeptidase-like protein [Mycena polygramma]